MIPISKPDIGDAEKRAVLEVMDSGMLVQGPRVAALEKLWAETCTTKHAIATSNGTTALHVALLAHGIGAGDEVITTPFTFIASVNSILFTGARPVFVDILPDSFNLDPSQIETAITSRTKAIIVVHLFGYPCNMTAIMAVAKKHGLIVIEDAAQAIGADHNGKPIGSFATACFSLYATKNVMSGEGGMITTNDDAIAKRCQMIRAHGMERRYYHDMLGYNFRLSDLHAAIGLVQLQRLQEFTQKRRANAVYLNTYIQNPKIVTPSCFAGKVALNPAGHVWHQYTVRAVGIERDEAIKKLTSAGVGTGIFYPVPAHRQNHIRGMGLGDVHMPIAEKMANQVLSLPVHPQLSQTNLQTIVEAVNSL